MRVYIETSNVRPPDSTPVRSTSTPKIMPEFSLNDIWGEPHSSSEWSGQPLLVNFWGTWCAPCRREMPLLQALHPSQNELQVIGIAIDREEDARDYMAEAGISYPSLVGEGDAMAVADLFGSDGLGLPFTVLVGSDSNILSVFVGEIDAAQLEEMAATSRAYENNELTLKTARKRLRKL